MIALPRLLPISWFLLLLLLLLVSPGDCRLFLSDKVGQHCSEESRHDCLAGGLFNNNLGGGFLAGVYMCREERSWFFWKRNETRCVPAIGGGTIAEAGDRCGCCSGTCPLACKCPCGEDNKHVWLYKKAALLRGTELECVSQGKASRWTAAESKGYSCVPENECPTMTPTSEPTKMPTVAEEEEAIGLGAVQPP